MKPQSAPRQDAARPASSAAPAEGLDLLGVTKRYEPLAPPVVDDLSLAVKPGEFTALLGPSGSGKTTALMMVAGFVAATAGDIRIGGRSIAGLPPESRNIGVVFQNYALFPHMTVRENIAFPLRMHRILKARRQAMVERALDLVGLGGFGARFPSQLSGGQQQRVALARAIVFEPPLLLMDEPLGALDKQLREQMQYEIRRLHKELKATVLYVTHDQREALTMADNVALMRNGRLEQVASPADIYANPASRFVASFIGDCNLLDVSAFVRSGDRWRVTVGGYGGDCGGPGPAEGAAALAVRPSHLILAPAGGTGLQGRIKDVVFAGESFDCQVTLEDGQTVWVRRAATPLEGAPAPGSGVTVSWMWEAARLV